MRKLFRVFHLVLFMACACSSGDPVFAITKTPAKDISANVSGFDGNLSETDTDVQKALQTLNDMPVVGSETDPVFSSSEAASITSTDTTNWDTAYSDRMKWDGGSSSLNAATGRTSLELGTASTASVNDFATATQGSHGETAFGWGNHVGLYLPIASTPWTSEGYLQEETDPVFSASEAHSINSTDTTNWDTAYGWGNHASAGYFNTNQTYPQTIIGGKPIFNEGIQFQNGETITNETDGILRFSGNGGNIAYYLNLKLNDAVIPSEPKIVISGGKVTGTGGYNFYYGIGIDNSNVYILNGNGVYFESGVSGKVGRIDCTTTGSGSLNLYTSGTYRLASFSTNGFLKTGSSDGTLSVDTNTYLTSVTAHNLLSTTHGDTTAGSVARGSIITGQGETPKWTALALPSTPTGKILTATATDVSWSSNPLTIGTNASVSGSNTGDQDLSSYIPKDGSVDFTGEPAFKATFTAGEALTAGDICYIKSSLGTAKAYKALGNAEATIKGRIVLATANISSGDSGTFLIRGYYTDSGLTVAATYFISTSTAGAKVTTAPTSGNFARVIGWAMSATSFYFDPSKDYIEVA